MGKTKKMQAKTLIRPGGKRPRERKPEEAEFLRGVGARLKAARAKQGMTGETLARAVGIAIATQYHREAGRQSFPAEDFHRYAAALDCRPADLLP